MNNWNKVEKRGKIYNESDIWWEYVKSVIYILLAVTYFYFIFWG